MSPAGTDPRPQPRAAYERWLGTLAGAGWSARSLPGDPGSADSLGNADAERVPVAAALGRVTAEPVLARWPSPRSACAAMDGIAVAAAALARPAEPGPVRAPAGAFEWIDTGDTMPGWADTVVERERLTVQADGSILIAPPPARRPAGHAGHGHRDDDHGHGHDGHDDHGHGRAGAAAGLGPVVRGRNVRQAGEDFAAGEVLVAAGRRLRPGDLAAAAAGGHTTLAVTRRPTVAIIPTGDEIRPIGATLRRGDIIDTNSLMLAARCRQLGAVPVVSDVVPDDPDALAAELTRAAADADLVLVIAGSSRGRGDYTAAVLAQVGGVAVAGIAIRPGHPALLGHVKRPAGGPGHPPAAGSRGTGPAGVAPVIGLPGYPLATAVIFELFGVALLAAAQGRTAGRTRVRARLDRDWSSPPGTEDWVLVTLHPGDGGPPLATPARRGASATSLLARADAWWPIPADDGDFAAGTQIEVLPIPGTD